ncbi:hypothetical protein U9M48_029044 [Paspalum notatum var. saurae]|uniref:Uncharacterized protein n=1 Tax=Paspalum notatum var. saurae TaxID=547442 RepID=A0AAQ3U0K3_PASNO
MLAQSALPPSSPSHHCSSLRCSLRSLSAVDPPFLVSRRCRWPGIVAYRPTVPDLVGTREKVAVDRHPEFKQSRCLFIVRTNGDLEDFSYRKCLKAYIEEKYPSHADRFLRKHLVKK